MTSEQRLALEQALPESPRYLSGVA
jgi:hypothetical protein